MIAAEGAVGQLEGTDDAVGEVSGAEEVGTGVVVDEIAAGLSWTVTLPMESVMLNGFLQQSSVDCLS